MGDKWERRQDEKGKATGAARNAAAAPQRLVRGKNRGGGDVADYSALDAVLLKRAIDAVTGAGCAIRFGYTRDKGAYAVGILGDGEPYTEYLRPTEDADYFFNALSEDFESVAAPIPDASPTKKDSKES